MATWLAEGEVGRVGRVSEPDVPASPPDLSGSPFLAACQEPAPRAHPRVVMRPAGRSLPEYRAIHGEGSILGTIPRPDLATEITLNRCAATAHRCSPILYSDIVTPVHAIGFGVDIAPGIGPVVDDVPVGGRSRSAPAARSGGRHALRDRDREEPGRRTAGAAHCVRRCTVHGGQLPDRGEAVSGPTAS